MKRNKDIIDRLEKAKKHQDFRLEEILLVFTGEVCAQMERLGINKAELAQRLNTSRAFITKVLKCNHNITLKTMDSIANALGMELSVNLHEARHAIKHVTSEISAGSIIGFGPHEMQMVFSTPQKVICRTGIESVDMLEECKNVIKFERETYALAS